MDRVQERRVKHLAKRGHYSTILPNKRVHVRRWKYARPHKGYGWFAGTNVWYSKLGFHGWKIPRNPLEWFSHKQFVIAITLLAVILSSIPLAQGPLFHSYVSEPKTCPDYEKMPQVGCNDPFTPIWDTTCAGCNNNLPDFNVFSGSNGGKVVFRANCVFTTACMDFGSDTTITSVALSNTTIGDLSVVSGKSLFSGLIWRTTTSTLSSGKQFGFYLTTNKTLPTHDIGSAAAYNPKDDSSVVLTEEFHCSGSCNSASDTINSGLSFLRTLGQPDSISKEDHGCPSGSPFMCGSGTMDPTSTSGILHQFFLNFTGNTNGSVCGVSSGGGCSFLDLNGNQISSSSTIPWFSFQAQQYYIGFYLMPNLGSEVYFTFDVGNGANNIQYFVNAPQTAIAPQIDTGGFFGPIIRALISIGVFILNAILGFIAFIAPAIITALTFLESIVQSALNAIGVAFGFPSSPGLGDDIFTFINSVITLFTVQVPNAFAQIGPIFNSWINSLVIVFTTGVIGQIFAFLSSILTFGANIIVFAFGLFTTGLQWTTLTAPFWLFIWFFAFNADEGMNGWIRWFEFAKWLAFDIGVKFVTNVINWTIDVITAAMALLPKPLVNIAGKFPRLPIIEIHGVFSVPDFNGRALREGNLFSILGMMFGFIGFVWYELTQTSIPGTLANQFSTQPWVQTASTAITFYKLFLPMGVLVVFLLMIPTLFTSIFGVVVPGPSVGFPKVRGTGPSRSFSVTGGSGRLFRARPPGRRSQAFIQSRLAKSEEKQSTRLRNQREEEAREKAENERLSRQQEQEEARKLEAQRGREAEASVRRSEAAKQKALEEQRLTAERRIRSEQERFS